MDDSYTIIDELADTFSDFHKEFYGFRPRFGSAADWANESWLRAEIAKIEDAFNQMKQTPEGRARLQEEGWVVE